MVRETRPKSLNNKQPDQNEAGAENVENYHRIRFLLSGCKKFASSTQIKPNDNVHKLKMSIILVVQ